MYNLNIHLKSIQFNRDLISPNDKVRVSITTVPEDNKAAFIISAKQIDNINNSFTVMITSKTRKILFVLRKKSFIQNDPIIASTIIRSNDFPDLSNSKNAEMKSIAIFEPLHNNDSSMMNHHYSKDHRKLFGRIEIIFRLEQLYTTQASLKATSKKIKRASSLNNTENVNLNDIMFIDTGI